MAEKLSPRLQRLKERYPEKFTDYMASQNRGGLSSLIRRPTGRLRSGDLTKIDRDRLKTKEDIAATGDMSTLDKIALSTAFIPVVGDIAGGVADTVTLAEDPNWTNLAFLLSGLVPFVPSGGVTKAALRASGQKLFTNLRNEIPGFYRPGATPVEQGLAFAKTLPEGAGDVIRSRYGPKARAIQDEFNISAADQKAARNSLKVTKRMTSKIDELTPELKSLDQQMQDMMTNKTAYTGEFAQRWDNKNKKWVGSAEQIPTKEFAVIEKKHKKLKEKISGFRTIASDAAKKAMGQLSQSRSMIKQYHGPDSGLEGFLKNIDKIDHIKTFKNFNVDDYFDTVGDLAGIDKKDITSMFKRIAEVQEMNPKKTYQMNIRRVYTGSAGHIDPGMTGSITKKPDVKGHHKEKVNPYTKWELSDTGYNPGWRKLASDILPDKKAPDGINLTKIKDSVFSSKRAYTSDKKFLEKLQEGGLKVLNPEEVLKGRAAIITGSGTTDAYELGGVNYMTSINKKGKVVIIISDEHDILSSSKLNKIIKTDVVGKLPGADRYMNVSEPITYDLIKKKKLTAKQQASKNKFDKEKEEARKAAVENYEKILGGEISGKKPEGFKTTEQWKRAVAVANLKPSHPDYSRLAGDLGIFAPMRASKPVLREDKEEKKGGGSVMMRNPYDYKPRAI